MNYKLALGGGRPIRRTYLTFGAPDIRKKEIENVVDSLSSGWLSTGEKVTQFEEGIGSLIGSTYTRAVNSCTAALHLSLIAAGVGSGDEVITTPLTFAATANVILHVGAKPVFVDVDPLTGNIDPDQVTRHVTKKTKAIIPVHLYGRPCEMDAIIHLAKVHHLWVIEDAAHALGASYRGKSIGTIGDFTCFSFYVTKNLVTGEGGMVATKHKRFAALIEKYSLHGMSHGAWKRYSDDGYKHYVIEVPGYKYNMMDMQAAIGLAQLSRFSSMQKRRARIWHRYMRELHDLPLTLPMMTPSYMVHALHLFTITLNLEQLTASRDTIVMALHKEGIGTGIHFLSLHLHPYYKRRYGYHTNDFPNATRLAFRTISLPLSSKLTDTDVTDVVRAVKKVLNYYRRPMRPL